MKFSLNGLEISTDEKPEFITECFGINHDVFVERMRVLRKQLLKELVVEETEDKTEAFINALSSEEFKALGWEISTPNDFLILGYMWSSALDMIKRDSFTQGIHVHNLGDLIDSLRKARKES